MGFRGTPHRSDGDRLPGVGGQRVGGEGFEVCALKCVKIHTVQDPSRETLIRVQWTFFAPGNWMALQWAHIAAGSPSEKSGRLPTIVLIHRMLLQIIQEFTELFSLYWTLIVLNLTQNHLFLSCAQCSLIVRLFSYSGWWELLYLALCLFLSPCYDFFTIVTISPSL